MSEIIDDVKLALRLSSDDFDSRLALLIESAKIDLEIAGITGDQAICSNPLVEQAIITYVAMHFSDSADYERLKASYDEQKAQMSMSTGYTVWE